ncbi:MAG TPA: hypothetical protein PLP19_03940 [bacterium]|nr:hypothetical protein [bacterium]HPN42619.1 hypothetical protein [bacterium]
MKIKEQLSLAYPLGKTRAGQTYKEKLTTLLQSDLDFHNQSSSYATHNFHSFPAKFLCCCI